jgi:hypothetical protein
MHKRAKFLFFCMIFVVGSATSQNLTYKRPEDKSLFYTKTGYPGSSVINTHSAFHQTDKKKYVPEKANIKPAFLLNPVSCSVISADYYTQGFGFFCKKELQFEKATKIPLRFRLGSLKYNDYLEQKPNAVKSF